MYREYLPRVEGLAHKYLRNPHAAEDAAQEVLLKAFQAWPTFDCSKPIWPWLAVITTRCCVDYVRKSARRPVLLSEEPDTQAVWAAQPAASTVEDDYLGGQRRGAIVEVLSGLPEGQRRVLTLRHMYGLSYEQIATRERLSLPAVKSMILRARRTFCHCYRTIAAERGLTVVPVFLLRVREAISRRLMRLRAWAGAQDVAQATPSLAVAILILAVAATTAASRPAAPGGGSASPGGRISQASHGATGATDPKPAPVGAAPESVRGLGGTMTPDQAARDERLERSPVEASAKVSRDRSSLRVRRQVTVDSGRPEVQPEVMAETEIPCQSSALHRMTCRLYDAGP
ncbi:MAG TPA: sigma-70 family RNA polymerase sigma factor [Actinomycetota bacterium]|nr:sigma-70 family RNA polymerase sigma factor [Actinomycetota bacterium]